MQTYKFDLKISKRGDIFLPSAIPYLSGREVELFIVPKKDKPNTANISSAKSFVSRWAGFLKDANFDPDKAKYEYLTEKYK